MLKGVAKITPWAWDDSIVSLFFGIFKGIRENNQVLRLIKKATNTSIQGVVIKRLLNFVTLVNNVPHSVVNNAFRIPFDLY